MGYAVEVPDEPPDRSVVLDRNSIAWQRDGNRWHPTAAMQERTWRDLVFVHGPLTALITENDCDPDPLAELRCDCQGELTDEQRDNALAALGQAIDYRAHDARIDTLKPTRAFPAGDEE